VTRRGPALPPSVILVGECDNIPKLAFHEARAIELEFVHRPTDRRQSLGIRRYFSSEAWSNSEAAFSIWRRMGPSPFRLRRGSWHNLTDIPPFQGQVPASNRKH
jgi:hypothetical protein